MAKRSTDLKYIKLKEYLKNCITEASIVSGEKIASENELSQKFGISRHTVRQAIGELVNEGWLYRTQGSGTFVSEQRRQNAEKSRIIGVITTYLDDYIFPDIIKGIDNVLSASGYSMILSHTNNKLEKEAQCIRNMLEKNVEGFIIEPTKSALPNPNLDLYGNMSKKGLPFVFINGFYASLEAPYVVEDDEEGGYMAANHLFSLGHERLGGIFKIDDIQGHNRYKGFLRAHRQKGIEILEDSIIWYTTEDMDSMFDESGMTQLSRRLYNISGIICYNDQVAVRLLEFARISGFKVPEGLSVVSFDDSKLADVYDIKLTSVAHPAAVLGEKAAENLLDYLESGKSSKKISLKPKLVVRNSTSQYSTTLQ